VQAIAEVFRHSRGLPRLINTICENALISAYARQSPSVTPDIIGNVAKEFRLNIVCSPEAEGIENQQKNDLEGAISALLDSYTALRRRLANDPDARVPVGAETSNHEPNI
jgi:hypothetical protein